MLIKFRSIIYFVLASFVFILLAVITSAFVYINTKGPLTAEKDVIIERGSGIFTTAQILYENGAINYPELFAGYAIVTGKNRKFKAGEYGFGQAATPKQIMEKLVKGEVKIHAVTIPEGITTHQVLEIVNADKVLRGKLNVKIDEGEVMPETYFFSRGYTRDELVERMKHGQKKTLLELWQTRDQSIPLKTPEEALVLASIVEKETGIKDEMERVAGVFYNRLNKNMPLQSDPTALYVVSKKTGVLERGLTTKDLQVASPYNTYVSKGLPPGPITNPGKKAIRAVLNPIKTDELYFVATGTGGHNFSKTLAEHNKHVANYRKILKNQN